MDDDDLRSDLVFQDTHGHDGDHTRWIFSYSDLVTLLLALFIVLYSLSSMNEKKVQELNQIMKEAFNKKTTTSASSSPSPQPKSKDIPLESSTLDQTLEQQLMNQDIQPYLRHAQMIGEYIELTLNSDMLFSKGSAFIDQEGRELLKKIAQALTGLPYPIRVEGHTDDQPIETILYPSNWELAAARASSVVRYLDFSGLNPRLLSAIAYGAEFPIASNKTVAGRALNRRVVIIIAKNDTRFKSLLDATLKVEAQDRTSEVEKSLTR